MAIRDVGGKPGATVGAGAAGGIPPTLEKGLGDAGLLKGGATPQAAAQSLLQNLKTAGFEAPPNAPKGDLANQLSTSLKQFQQVNSLPKNGQLDGATQSALKNAGIIKNPEGEQTKQKTAQDGFEKNVGTALKAGEKQRAEVMSNQTPDTNFLDALINQLGPGGPNQGTSASDVKGAAEAHEAQSKLSEAKKGEGVQKKGSTTDAQKEKELATNQQLDKANSAGVKVARGLKTDQAKTDEKKRKDALAGKDPTEAGILDEEADEDALEGAGDDGKKKRGKGGDHDGGADDGTSDSGAEGGDKDGDEKVKGNASSGGEDDGDARRGNASTDDGSGDDGEHYRIPSMSEQAFAALLKITRDTHVENRATTYSWDVTFFRPGVYAAGQKAQEIVHLVVEKATAFDPVWTKAQANIGILVKRLDTDGNTPSVDDIIAAIRQARARDGDDSAGALKKVVRPMGRA